MGAQIREYRQRIRSVSATKKITRAMELMAASRVVKAQQAVRESTPYARALTRAVSAVATFSNEDHPLTSEKEDVKQAAVLIIAADRGLAGGYNSNVLKESERLVARLVEEGKEVRAYLVGRRAVNFYTFRRRDFVAEWTGFTEKPTFENAREIGEKIVADFTDPDPDSIDEVHVVYTRFVSMVTQEPQVIRLLPLEVVEGEEKPAKEDVLPLYSFEPSAEGVLDALLPKYVNARLFNCLLQAAASELAARQRAMKSATDNAEELIRKYTRLANQARQAEITQEISEIVGGASALAESK
ncbi:MAG TPA: F0F1 ATP synthase subunit gamma [Phycicoccus elongatus]|jgi:F-type H+-transporting ATPase subunit gamma|uniref:F0F1 ATP synthase subunit gamma n=1 Tax=Phycicoccus TaxID=367298 RepID=UPI001DF6E5A1|nr:MULTISPECIES: F0F1 ATP synthase subunit gamma [Phycicoccus]MCB1238283.1 F0F1 ATP synthase subunit gamma [Tetrasphaera sp.]MCB9407430.1 F0F1 ATP synthase subunit gamma [Tetrasphaera sp.]MCO5304247.1 F0F1 ATP synthase subunit gamma [Phycicoccus sp.]HPF75117.1 F0F1 ATP synthase subunit gamma [Phycicoccus elongatus]HPK12370.1 F0F1 ATP synthase subunit gamma [Phycicoccus elongatus]